MKRISPVVLAGEPGPQDAVILLEFLYDPEDTIFVGARYDKRVAPVHAWLEKIKTGGVVPWPHIMPNTVTGGQHPTKNGTQSFRADSAVSQFTYAVAEMDDASRQDQVQFWFTVISEKLLRVSCLVDSGGKSIHAWIRVNQPDRAAWSLNVEQNLFERWLVPLGADGACKNPSRLSRTPGHFRGEKEQWQRLLYLNPCVWNR
ncbi:MAG: hypothetical protein EOM20_11245 [Spartobacteria bacterium]|nr:hypothetical protein [Spartobacteria bacterium]